MCDPFRQRTKELFSQNDLFLDDLQVEQFRTYHSAIQRWNDRVNLVSRKDQSRLVERHFLESAALICLEELAGSKRVLDLGTGAGFPGLPLKIMNDKLRLTLLDSKRLKTIFLRNLVRELELHEVEVVCERAETLSQHGLYRGKFDVVLARAVAESEKLFGLGRPFLRSSGKLITVKGPRVEQEIERLCAAFPDASILLKGLQLFVRNQGVQRTILLITPPPS